MFCRRQLAGLQDIVPQLRERSATIVGISVDDPQESRMLRSSLGLEFPLLFDDAAHGVEAHGERDGVNSTSAVLRLPGWHSRTRPAVAMSPKRYAPR